MSRIIEYDFKHPARMNKAQMRFVQNLHEEFARLLNISFNNLMRSIVDVDIEFVDQTTYREFIQSLSNPGVAYQFHLGPKDMYDGQVIIDFQMPIVFGVVDRAFGGKGCGSDVEPRQISQTEMGIFVSPIRQAIWDLEDIWKSVVECEVHDIELETNPEFMTIVPDNEIVLMLAFGVNSTNAKGRISMCYPYRTLQPILASFDQSGQNRIPPRQGATGEELRHANRLRVGAMDLPTTAVLGRTSVTVAEAEQLTAGDVIRLPTRKTDPAILHIGGKAKYLARPFVEDTGELKLQVAARIPSQLQTKYGTVAE